MVTAKLSQFIRTSAWRHAVHGAAVLAGFISISAHAQDWVPFGPELSTASVQHMGSAIAVHSFNDAQGSPVLHVFVGAPDSHATSLPSESGVVEIFSWTPHTGWQFVRALAPPTPQAGAHFGSSLAFGGGHLLVGSPDYDDSPSGASDSGRVDFYNDAETDAVTLTSEGNARSTGGNLGSVLAADGNMAVAAKLNAQSGQGCLATYRFLAGHSPEWEAFPAQATALRCGSTHAALGSSLAIRQTGSASFKLVAGATGESPSGLLFAGTAHVYVSSTTQTTLGGLVETAKLNADNPNSFDFFGSSVGLDDEFVFVGGAARSDTDGAVGSVTVFSPLALPSTGYANLIELFPETLGTSGGKCGSSMSVDAANGRFMIGCPNSTVMFAGEGTARVYTRYTLLGHPVWLEDVLSFGSEPHGADALGTSVSLTGDRAFAGAPNADANQGAFQAFEIDEIFAGNFE